MHIATTSDNYQRIWENRSSVRSRPRKIIDFQKSGFFFPEDKQPILLIKDLQNISHDQKSILLIMTFKKYLSDIVNLEIKLICNACNTILHDQLVVSFAEKTKLDVYSILVDEYYHVYLAQDMLIQIDTQYPNLPSIPLIESDASQAVSIIKKSIPQKYHKVFEILAVCIFETTLIKELVSFFDSNTLNPSIKAYVNDHLNDEARHFNFFFELMTLLWKKIPLDYKAVIGRQIAKFIHIYLNIKSEKQFNRHLLEQFYSSSIDIPKEIEMLYADFELSPEIPIIKNVMNVLNRSKITHHPEVIKGFDKYNWDIGL